MNTKKAVLKTKEERVKGKGSDHCVKCRQKVKAKSKNYTLDSAIWRSAV